MRLAAIAIAAIAVAVAPAAGADPDATAAQALQDADRRAVAGDPGAIDAYEALGAAQPVTRWSDDAWVRAARLAEQARDFGRARRALERAIAIDSDPRLVDRARADLARLVADTGGGRWDRAAADHERLAGQLAAAEDPAAILAALEALVIASPGYPRRAAVVLAVAEGWERDGNAGRAIDWLAARRADAPAPGDVGGQLTIALIRTLIRAGELDRAAAELRGYQGQAVADPLIVQGLAEALREATVRAHRRLAVSAVLLVLALVALVQLRRITGTAGRALRRLARPPTEAVFLLPVGAVLAGVAATGNPMVARAVWQIAAGGVCVAWLSGVVLEARRAAGGAIGAPRAAVHVVAALVAVAAVVYLALDSDHMIDLVAETWRAGPAMR